MNERDVNGKVDMEAGQLRRLRLGDFMRDLIRQEGKMEAAKLLGVNHKTLTRAEESGEITGRMTDALELLLRRADDAEVTRLREVVGALEERLAALEGGAEAPPAVEAAGKRGSEAVQGDEPVQPQDYNDGGGAGRSETGVAPPVAGLRPRKPFTERPLDPEIVTEEPADDDPEVYGAAWPLVEEWRRLRDGHPTRGRTLSWLTTEERLLALELEMLEEHGLTLPPEKQPLRGFARKGQTTHRWTALADTRVALRRRKLLRWVRRILTCWLWRR